MYKPIINKKPECDFVKPYYDVKVDAVKSSASLVPASVVKYPELDTFDVDVLAKNGMSPELVTAPFISSDLDTFDAQLDYVNQTIDDNEIIS